jgi:hypothetical protein
MILPGTQTHTAGFFRTDKVTHYPGELDHESGRVPCLHRLVASD